MHKFCRQGNGAKAHKLEPCRDQTQGETSCYWQAAAPCTPFSKTAQPQGLSSTVGALAGPAIRVCPSRPQGRDKGRQEPQLCPLQRSPRGQAPIKFSILHADEPRNCARSLRLGSDMGMCSPPLLKAQSTCTIGLTLPTPASPWAPEFQPSCMCLDPRALSKELARLRAAPPPSRRRRFCSSPSSAGISPVSGVSMFTSGATSG